MPERRRRAEDRFSSRVEGDRRRRATDTRESRERSLAARMRENPDERKPGGSGAAEHLLKRRFHEKRPQRSVPTRASDARSRRIARLRSLICRGVVVNGDPSFPFLLWGDGEMGRVREGSPPSPVSFFSFRFRRTSFGLSMVRASKHGPAEIAVQERVATSAHAAGRSRLSGRERRGGGTERFWYKARATNPVRERGAPSTSSSCRATTSERFCPWASAST